MTTLFFEITIIMLFLGTIHKKIFQDSEIKPYGCYNIFLTKKSSNLETVYVLLSKQLYQTEEDFEFDYNQIMNIALNEEKNKFFKSCGYTGISIVNIDTGIEEAWCSLK